MTRRPPSFRGWATVLLGAALTAGSLPRAAHAITVTPTKQTCPVGGEVFGFSAVGSFSTFGARPDGRPYGVLTGFPMPECPGNHLVMFRPFKPEEVERLKTLIASPAYRALISDGTSSARAAWLAQALGDPPREIAIRLLAASWDADDQPQTKRRLQRDFVDVADGLDPLPGDVDSLWLLARRANTHRELGQFATALAQAKALTRTLSADANVKPDERQNLATYLSQLEAVIRRSDSSAEPLDMIPDAIRRDHCHALGAKAAKPPKVCSRP